MYNKGLHDEIIKKSHERSKKYGVEKERSISKKILKGGEISTALRENADLIKKAAPFMKILYDFLKDSGFILVLTDRKGCILNLIGDKDIVNIASTMNMVVGAYMDEKSIGTNAMGTAIKEDMPIQISAKEHFITAYHKWTCSAAPIHGEDGKIIGTLNLTGGSNLVHPHTLGLVVAGVKSIENSMSADATKKKLLEAYDYLTTITNSIHAGLMAVSVNGKVEMINTTASEMLGLDIENIYNQNINKVLDIWSDILRKLKEGKKYQEEEEYIGNVSYNKKKVSISAYPIKSEGEEITAVVLLFRDIQRVYNIVNKYTGMRARYNLEDIVGESLLMKNIIREAKEIAESPSTVLIEGESGTGKEVFAQAIHNYSTRRENGFVAINCGAIPANLIESELFGYDEGAFTGAKKGGHPGKFELASGGTIFLDEIGEMPLDMQVRLLRVLQEGVVTRVSGTKYIPVNARVIAATNKDLKEEIIKGRFRQDLYYRLSVIPMTIPPLRERREDIPIFFNKFLKEKALKLGRPIPKITEETYRDILNYNYPGNVRELENIVENIINLGGKSTLPFKQESGETLKKEGNYTSKISTLEENKLEPEKLYGDEFIRPLEDLEKIAITAAMNKYKGNMTKVAKELNISRNTLYLKIKKYNLTP